MLAVIRAAKKRWDDKFGVDVLGGKDRRRGMKDEEGTTKLFDIKYCISSTVANSSLP